MTLRIPRVVALVDDLLGTLGLAVDLENFGGVTLAVFTTFGILAALAFFVVGFVVLAVAGLVPLTLSGFAFLVVPSFPPFDVDSFTPLHFGHL